MLLEGLVLWSSKGSWNSGGKTGGVQKLKIEELIIVQGKV